MTPDKKVKILATLGLAPLTAPFILACWLVHATGRVWHQASLDTAPCALRANHPRLR